MRVTIVGLRGKQGAGKTSLMKALRKSINAKPGWRAEPLTFAEPLYQIHDFARGVLRQNGFPPPPGKEIKDGPFLQFIGTDWGRKEYQDDIWIQILLNRIRTETDRIGKGNAPEHLVFIVSDMRFKNEFHALEDGLRVNLEASEACRKPRCEMWRENTQHPSEIDLDEYAAIGLFDLTIDTENYPVDHAVNLVMAQLLKQNWKEHRG